MHWMGTETLIRASAFLVVFAILAITTGLRFHPIEIIISMIIKLAAVATLGAPPVAVLLFEIALNATSMFNHSNIRIPNVYTPDLSISKSSPTNPAPAIIPDSILEGSD